jgi:hypothetical protein
MALLARPELPQTPVAVLRRRGDDPSKGDVPVHAAVAVKVHDHVDVND